MFIIYCFILKILHLIMLIITIVYVKLELTFLNQCNFFVHHWLSKRRFISFVVSKSSVTNHIYNYISIKFLSILSCNLCTMNNRLWSISILVTLGSPPCSSMPSLPCTGLGTRLTSPDTELPAGYVTRLPPATLPNLPPALSSPCTHSIVCALTSSRLTAGTI